MKKYSSMKKFSFLIITSTIIAVIVLSAFFASSIPVFAETSDSISSINETLDETIEESINEENIKFDDREPCYGEYEFIEADYETNAADTKDQYENNNSFGTATSLYTTLDGKPKNYTKSIYATLHRNSWLWGLIKRDVDEDYYRFDVFGEAKVSISLSNIPSGCDYDIKLYMYDNIRYSGEEDISLVTSSVRADNNPESISKTLQPGTYYVWIYSYNDECDDSTDYNLSVNVSYTAEDVTISSLRFNKGAKAALWISDYDPCGISLYSENSKVEVGVTSYSDVVTVKFQNPFTRYFTSGEPIEHAALYIWNKDFRNQLRDELGVFYDQLLSSINSDKALSVTIEHTESIINGVSVVTSIFITVCLSSNPATMISSIVVSVAPTVLGLVADAIFPTGNWDTTKADLLNYISNLRVALETSSQTSDNEVVKISTMYIFKEEKFTLTTVTGYYFDFTPIMQSEYLYDSDTIGAWNSNSIVNGKVYGIVTADNLSDAINRKDYTLSDVNTSVVNNIYLENSIPGELYIGEYNWFSFTAPSTGTYSFYTENSFDTYGELFSELVPARSTDFRLAYDDDSNGSLNFKIDYELQYGQTVYLRVRGFNWTRYGLYSVRVSKIS